MDATEKNTNGGSDGRLRTDLVVERSPGDSLFIVTACHRRAADWLISSVGGMPVDDRRLEEVMLAAVTARFNVPLAFQGQPRVVGGLRAATDVD